MQDEFPTPWKFLTRTYDIKSKSDKAYYERIVSVEGDKATIEVDGTMSFATIWFTRPSEKSTSNADTKSGLVD